MAEQLRALTARYQAQLLVNDRLDVALAVEADGVHLGQNSFSVEDARRLLGAGKLIGVSTHSRQEITAARRADFMVFGPVYYTLSKAAYGEPQGLDRLRAAVAHSTVPVFAIGGIKTERVAEVLETGAHGIAHDFGPECGPPTPLRPRANYCGSSIEVHRACPVVRLTGRISAICATLAQLVEQLIRNQ